FLIMLGHEGEVLAKVKQRALPPGIIRLADDIVRNPVRVYLVEECLGRFYIAATVDVNHDEWTRIIAATSFNASGSGLQQLRELVPILWKFPVGPKHAVNHFIAKLDHFRCRSVRPKSH